MAATRMSARTPQWSSPNQRPVRPNPVITSSAMSSTPWRRQTSAIARPVVVRRDGGRERRPDDRLGDERRDRARARRLDRPLELGRELRRRTRARGRRARRRGTGTAADTCRNRPEPVLVRPAERPPARQVERAERVAVVAAPARDDDPAVGLAAGQVVRPAELQRGLDRLRAAADRVDRRVVDRQARPDLRGVGLDRLGRERRAVGVREAGRLLPEDPGDRRSPVTDVDDDRAAGRVEVLAPGRVADRGAVGLDRDRQVGIERAAEDAAGHGPSVRAHRRAHRQRPAQC